MIASKLYLESMAEANFDQYLFSPQQLFVGYAEANASNKPNPFNYFATFHDPSDQGGSTRES